MIEALIQFSLKSNRLDGTSFFKAILGVEVIHELSEASIAFSACGLYLYDYTNNTFTNCRRTISHSP